MTTHLLSSVLSSTPLKSGIEIGESMQSENSCMLIDLSPLRLIHIGGEDALSFLQGQLSNDVAALETGMCQLQAYCNPKGRVLAIMRMMKHDDGFWILIPNDISEKLTLRLRMFVLRAKVTIEPDPDHTAFCTAGNDAMAINWPQTWRQYNVDGVTPRKIIVAPTAEFVRYSADVSRWEYGDHSIWRLIDIQSGIPQVFEKTMEAFIPQMINLDLVNGVSFRKGCYPGQEIIARLRYLGKLKQRMLIGKVNTGDQVSPGDEIFSNVKPDQKSGLVVDAVRVGDNQFRLSTMVPATLFDEGELTVGSATGPAVERTALPYAIPADRKEEKSKSQE